MHSKEHVMGEDGLRWDGPPRISDLFDELVAEFLSLFLLQDDHVVGCLAVDLGLVLEQAGELSRDLVGGIHTQDSNIK